MKLKSKSVTRYIFGTVVGFLILATGAVAAKMMRETGGMVGALPYIFIGIGAGIFGNSSSNLIKILTLKNSPEVVESIEIEQNDERNVMILDKARAQSYQLAMFVYGALMLAFGLMKVDISIVLTMVIAYLFVTCSSVYFKYRLEKYM